MNQGKFRWNGWDLLEKLADAPHEIVQWAKGKTGTLLYESAQLDHMTGIRLTSDAVDELRARLKKGRGNAEYEREPSAAESALLARIRAAAVDWNRNNVTRTQAYLDMYRRHPELHWSLLAHMVSRNGGWNMTDLKGELLPYLLNETRQKHVFAFLERANALIFHDSYPQLLLYEASLKAGKPLFRLLRHLQVSSFMRPVWEQFWERRDSALLTVAMIVNEQNFIESRVVRHPVYRETVLDTLLIHAQLLLQLNQIVLPYRDAGQLRLAGLVLENFNHLKERIEVGKRLYAILFGIPAVAQGALSFAASTRHSGSRADYWPHLFSAVRHFPPVPRGQLKEWLDGCKLRPGASPLYSPRLSDVWKDCPFAACEPGDWYRHDDREQWLAYLSSTEPPFSFEMTHEYCFGLNKIELAVLAGDLLE
ncbi:DUF2515 domain-containing protein [Paenibacillus doosanensis]|uniref:DUF2515 domain-containing protein n=1 Tax=Paenibacillus doosanensis TaxID=1229154 RepID=UPI0021806F5F|nr:DUF2515 domain-containing protein [Paenibacillus doosanensis]MCS7460240.1 DUF2515 domain-containing protein [Paenibacillus doosanensis]